MEKPFYSVPSELDIMAFADRHFAPYRVKHGELIAETCPFCKGGESGDHGTFYVSLDTGQYYCHRGKCGARGGWVRLLRHFGEAPNINSVSQQFKPLNIVPQSRTETINKYFAGRGISTETLDKFQVGADTNGNILWPFYVEGELVYAKFRQPVANPGKRKEWAEAGAAPVLFGMDLCKPGEPLCICEGQIDCLSLYEAGVRNAVSVPAGCENFQWIDSCYSWLSQFDKIILFGDNDPPGRKMINTLVRRLGDERCLVVEQYPDGCKDANDILINCGAEALLATLKTASEVPIRGLRNLADVEDVDPTTVPRIKTMIPRLDAMCNALALGDITIMTGASGNGKSTLSGTILLAAIEQGYSVCAVSLELPNVKYKEWIDLQAAGSQFVTLKYDSVKNCQIPVVFPPAAERIHQWYNNKFFLYENSDIDGEGTTIADSILAVFTAAAKRKGCSLFLVDNLMTALADSYEDEYRAQARFVAQLKRFAVKYNAHVLIVAHPRKTKQGESIQKDDVGGSSYITNLASNVLSINKPDISLLKSRDSGITGVIECCYCGDSRRIYQADVGDKYVFSWDRTGLTPPRVRADSLPEYGIYRALKPQMF